MDRVKAMPQVFHLKVILKRGKILSKYLDENGRILLSFLNNFNKNNLVTTIIHCLYYYSVKRWKELRKNNHYLSNVIEPKKYHR